MTKRRTDLPAGYDNWRTWTPCQEASHWGCSTCSDEHWIECERCEGDGFEEGCRPGDETIVNCKACAGKGGEDCPDCEDERYQRESDACAYDAWVESEIERRLGR